MTSASANTDSESSTSQTSVSAWEKPSSPYFLHSSENPGLILVNQPLTKENYATWSQAIIYALDSKNKLILLMAPSKLQQVPQIQFSLLGRNATEWSFLG